MVKIRLITLIQLEHLGPIHCTVQEDFQENLKSWYELQEKEEPQETGGLRLVSWHHPLSSALNDLNRLDKSACFKGWSKLFHPFHLSIRSILKFVQIMHWHVDFNLLDFSRGFDLWEWIYQIDWTWNQHLRSTSWPSFVSVFSVFLQASMRKKPHRWKSWRWFFQKHARFLTVRICNSILRNRSWNLQKTQVVLVRVIFN